MQHKLHLCYENTSSIALCVVLSPVREGTHRATAGALVAVVGGACKAGAAEAVAAGSRHRLEQQLQAQYALEVVQLTRYTPRPTLGSKARCVALLFT